LWLGGSGPYTSTDKTNTNKYTYTKQYKKHSTNTKHRHRNSFIREPASVLIKENKNVPELKEAVSHENVF
jgi:hypothetical protein